MRERTTHVAMVTAVLAIVGGAWLYAGPLNPPAGPIASTGKSIGEIEPRIAINGTNTPGDATSSFRINQPGSYYLTSNLTGASGKVGIRIAASNVTIDLNGYTLRGVTGSLDGITTAGALSNVSVLNGTVELWGEDGIDLDAVSRPGGRLEGVTSHDNIGQGIAAADGSVVINCQATANDLAGFDVTNEATFINCVAKSNTGDGFDNSLGGTFINCIARFNGADGFGFAGGYATFDSCSASLNSGNGFALSRSTLHNCDATSNTGTGFVLTNGAHAIECTASGNDAGGFNLATNCTVRDCHVTNGTTGILATGSNNRLEGNTVINATTGISVTGTGNIIVRNAVTGGTRYSIAANNMAGPIVTAAGLAGSTNPASNYDY